MQAFVLTSTIFTPSKTLFRNKVGTRETPKYQQNKQHTWRENAERKAMSKRSYLHGLPSERVHPSTVYRRRGFTPPPFTDGATDAPGFPGAVRQSRVVTQVYDHTPNIKLQRRLLIRYIATGIHLDATIASLEGR